MIFSIGFHQGVLGYYILATFTYRIRYNTKVSASRNQKSKHANDPMRQITAAIRMQDVIKSFFL